MEFLYIISIFSLIGFLVITGYLFWKYTYETSSENEYLELLEDRVSHLEHYIYELEEKLSPLSQEIKEQIIQMYKDGKTLTVIENALKIPKTKIEMVLKEYLYNNEK
jgi:hypothetical protein